MEKTRGNVDYTLLSSRHDNRTVDTSCSAPGIMEITVDPKTLERLRKLEDSNVENNNNNNIDNKEDNYHSDDSTSEDDYISASSDDDLGGGRIPSLEYEINKGRQNSEISDVGTFPAIDEVKVYANIGHSNCSVLNQLGHTDHGRTRSLSRISEGSHTSFEFETKDDFHLLKHEMDHDVVTEHLNESEVILTKNDLGHHSNQSDIFHEPQSPKSNFHKNVDTKYDILSKSEDCIVSGNIKDDQCCIIIDNTFNLNTMPTNSDLTSADVASESTLKSLDDARFIFPDPQIGLHQPHFDISLPSDSMGQIPGTHQLVTSKSVDNLDKSKPAMMMMLTEATIHNTKDTDSNIPRSLRNLTFLTNPETPSSSVSETHSLTALNPGFLLTSEGKRSNLKKKPFMQAVAMFPASSNANSIDGSSSSLNGIGNKKSIKWVSDITDPKKPYSEPQTSNQQENLKVQTTSRDNPLSRENSRKINSGQNPCAINKKVTDIISGYAQNGKENKLNKKVATPVDVAEKFKETDGPSSRANSESGNSARLLGNKDSGVNSIVRVHKGHKGKTTVSTENKSASFISGTVEDNISLGMMATSADQSTPGDVTPKDCLTDVEDTVTSFEELERKDKRAEMAGDSGASENQDATLHDMDPSNVELRNSSKSEKKATGRIVRLLPDTIRNNAVVILSGIYGITIVVLGLVLPLSETFAKPEYPYFFEIFYLYLYILSMAFLVYVYTYLLRKEQTFLQTFPRTISRTLSRTFSRSSMRSRTSAHSDKSGPTSSKPLVRQNSQNSANSFRRRRKIAYNSQVSNHTGSFYLRVGVIGFGIGSMIHSGLTFGHYLEISQLADHCSNAFQGIKPLVHLSFTFVQMYFIFMNSKMCVHKYKTLARFGLMHMSCTNICVWLQSVVVETLQVIKVDQRKTYSTMVQTYEQEHAHSEKDSDENEPVQTLEEYLKENKMEDIPEINCRVGSVMGRIVENSSVYLYPCTIEYSLICACVLYVMWSNVGEGYTPRRPESTASDVDTIDSDDDSDDEKANHRMSVDCAASSRGLFLGILLFVAAVVCIVCFYVLTSAKSHVTAGILLGHVSEEIILVVAFVATAIAAYQMRQMRFSGKRKVGIEEILTLVSISGLGLYGIWSIIAAVFHLDSLHGRLILVTNLFMLVQAGSQAIFTLAALRASVRNHQQLRSKPGRQCVTFLLICNFALWVVNTFETQRIEYNQTQVDFYGTTAWAIFSHISVPLGIYFRFHSTVNLSIVWKKAWKKKDHHESTISPGHQSA